MLTTDLALRFDPAYEKISRRFHEHPQEFADAFAKAWFKLTHRDMGPIARYLGPQVPKEPQLWQDPVPAVDARADRRGGHRRPEGADPRVGPVGLAARLHRLGLGLDVPRHRQARRRQRRARPPRAAEGLGGQQPAGAGEGAGGPRGDPEGVQRRAGGGKKQVSLADLIVLGGCAAVEKAAKDAGHDVTVPFTPGRTDATQEQTDVESFAVLEPDADGFRNYIGEGHDVPAEHLLIERAFRLDAERARDDRARRRPAGAERERRQSDYGAFTTRPGTLTNDFFVNLLDMGTEWKPTSAEAQTPSPAAAAEGRCASGPPAASTSSSARTRSCARSPRSTPATTRRRSSCATSSAAWDKVMNLDRFDVARA